MSLPDLIGITGYAQVGKSTAAEYLASDHGYCHIAFADPLRSLALELDSCIWNVAGDGLRWGTPDVRFGSYARVVNKLGYEEAKRQWWGVRDYLKRLGNGARKHLGEDVWVRAAMNRVTPSSRFVVSDVRFLNEAEAIIERGGVVIRIVRPGTEAESDFEREVPLIEDDYRVVNDGTLADFGRKLHQTIEDLKSPSGRQLTLPF